MDRKQVAKSTAQVLISYLTYQAMRTVVAQLSETNPPQAIWLNGFSTTGKLQNGETYLEDLFHVEPGLALRIMTVRAHLAEEVVDFLPEMVRTGVQQANMELQRQQLERITHLSVSDTSTTTESDPEPDTSPDT